MRVANEHVDVRMEMPGVVIRQRKNVGDVSGFDMISDEYVTLAASSRRLTRRVRGEP